MYFDELELNPEVLDALDAMHFEECTPVQEHAIPPILAGRDVIGVAQTGTGKTAAYLLPILNRMMSDAHPDDAVNCIIMSPTRELAQQIDNQMEAFSYFLPFHGVAVYGGNDGIRFAQEERGLKLGADVVIATPGRLLAHVNMGYVDFSRVSYFVLDEADRMLDMGFSDDIMEIVKLLPKERQTILFSATMPDNIKSLAKTILRNPVEVQIAISKPAEGIHQRVAFCTEHEKQNLLLTLLGSEEETPNKTIVFSSSKKKVKEVALLLRRKGVSLEEMHSDLDQKKRDEVMLAYRNNTVRVLIATDIVSRGIDIDDIEQVVNYDVPHDAEDYVHRIGRTARANREGASYTFVSERERPRWRSIEKFLGKQIERMHTEQNPPTTETRTPRPKDKPRPKRRNFHRRPKAKKPKPTE